MLLASGSSVITSPMRCQRHALGSWYSLAHHVVRFARLFACLHDLYWVVAEFLGRCTHVVNLRLATVVSGIPCSGSLAGSSRVHDLVTWTLGPTGSPCPLTLAALPPFSPAISTVSSVSLLPDPPVDSSSATSCLPTLGGPTRPDRGLACRVFVYCDQLLILSHCRVSCLAPHLQRVLLDGLGACAASCDMCSRPSSGTGNLSNKFYTRIFRELTLGSEKRDEKWILIFGTVGIIGVVPRTAKSSMEPCVTHLAAVLLSRVVLFPRVLLQEPESQESLRVVQPIPAIQIARSCTPEIESR